MPTMIGSPDGGKTILLPTVLSMKTVLPATNENGVVQWPTSSPTTGDSSGAGSASEASSGHAKPSTKTSTTNLAAASSLNCPSASTEVDTGILLKTPPKTLFKRDLRKATDEIGVSTQTLIHASGLSSDSSLVGVENNLDKQAEVAKLHEFMKIFEAQKQQASGGQPQQHGGGGSKRNLLLQINMAISVLYSRQVLAALLAHWPFRNDKDRMITAELLSCKDEQQIPCVLDLLQKSQPSESFKKVVKNVIQMCHPKCLLPMAITACHFMEEITFHELTKESEHCYAATSQVEEKVIFCFVKF